MQHMNIQHDFFSHFNGNHFAGVFGHSRNKICLEIFSCKKYIADQYF